MAYTYAKTKESFHVVSRRTPQGDDFKVLGVIFDCELRMEGAVRKLAGEARWKLKALLKSASFYIEDDLCKLYKSKLLSFLEYRAPASYHAEDSVLEELGKVQEKLLKAMGCTPQ